MTADSILEHTGSLCDECLSAVPATVIARRGSAYLIKECPIHGQKVELLEEDADWYGARMAYNKPASPFVADTATTTRGCPYDCGLCPEHDQHTCIGLIEVGSGCDLKCPVCYASSGGNQFLDFEQIKKMIDYFIQAEGGSAEILQLSGGEPTLHPDILKIVEYARTKPIKHIMLNTNGMRIANDLAFTKALSGYGGGFEVYLQFDGLSPRTSQYFRGAADLTELKTRAVNNLSQTDVPTTLAVTLASGVNEHEIAPIIDYAISCPSIRGINFQPIALFGRLPSDKSSRDRLTLSGVLRRIQDQTNGMIERDDFIPLPCNVHRVALTYLLRQGKNFIPIARDIEIKRYLDFLGNTFTFDAEELLAHAKARIAQTQDCCSLVTYLKNFLPRSFESFERKQKATFVTGNTFRISVSSFVDIYNFEAKAIKRECVHVITPDFKRIPFSTWNMFHRASYAA